MNIIVRPFFCMTQNYEINQLNVTDNTSTSWVNVKSFFKPFLDLGVHLQNISYGSANFR